MFRQHWVWQLLSLPADEFGPVAFIGHTAATAMIVALAATLWILARSHVNFYEKWQLKLLQKMNILKSNQCNVSCKDRKNILKKPNIIVYIIVLMIINSHSDHETNFMNVPKAVLINHHNCDLLYNIIWRGGESCIALCSKRSTNVNEWWRC